jgi:hypothetical protein
MKFKRLYFDLEVSPNLGLFWKSGFKLNISPEDIIQERAIMCVCYKWEGDSQINSMVWNKGDDKELLIKFTKILQQADEVIGHNGDRFDIKWFRTRCLYHRIPCPPNITSVDTLKLAKNNFLFNSNKLDYIGDFLGLGKKIKTEYGLWKDILLHNSTKAMKAMVTYCKRDVQLLEDVHVTFKPYVPHKTHVAVLLGGEKIDCPECASENTQKRGFAILASGVKKQRCQCNDCGKWYQIAFTTATKQFNERNRKDLV